MEAAKERKLFSKAHVVLQSDGMRAVYRDCGYWIVEEITDTGSLQSLVRESHRAGIRIKKEQQIEFLFEREEKRGRRQIFPPLRKQMSPAAWEEIVQKMQPSEEFLQYMEGTDLSDEEKTKEKMLGWVELVMERERGRIIKMDALRRWKKLAFYASELAGLYGCGSILSEPDAGSDGFAEFHLSGEKKGVLWLEGEKKELFLATLRVSELFALEMNVESGYLNVTLFC